MQLSPQDLPLLYGTHLFVLDAGTTATDEPQAVQATTQQQPTLAEEPRTTYSQTRQPQHAWLNPEGARLSIVLPRNDYSDAACQDLLNKILQALGLAPAQVSMHPTTAEPTTDVLAVAPAHYVLGFGIVLPAVEGKKTYSFSSLALMLSDVAAKRKAWEAMKLFKSQL